MNSNGPRLGIFLSDEDARPRLDVIRSHVAKPIPREPTWRDDAPALAGGCVLVGNQYHASNLELLKQLQVTAVLNCASGGISRLPVDELKDMGVMYQFTNVRQDNHTYPILFDDQGQPSQHLEVAKEVYGLVKNEGGKVLFFCIAGQNRSATLAVAVLMLFGHKLDDIVCNMSTTRSFVLENVGFQRQLVELEAMLQGSHNKKLKLKNAALDMYTYGTPAPKLLSTKTTSDLEREARLVEVELLIPGFCTMEARIPIEATIKTVKQCLIDHANEHLLAYADPPAVVVASWVVLAMFGYDDMYDFPLENEAIELGVQLERMQSMFQLGVQHKPTESVVTWNGKCRFALVIFSVQKTLDDGTTIQEPWTFTHEERPGAPATLLENTLMNTNLRAWDFVTGQSYCSKQPIVFSFSHDPRDKRQFMKISTSANEPVQFHAPGEGGILGMGSNAIVHRVELKPITEYTNIKGSSRSLDIFSDDQELWDAAVKRPFSLSKMLTSLENRSEAGLAKRLRLANSLNSDGRVVEFYGLGVALSANAYNQQEYKFEATLLARYEEEFSTYTMRRFMEDFIAIPDRADPASKVAIEQLQRNFSLISVKILLVSLLNGFRDLTLMGVQAFDFNHLNNVLISRDHRTVRLIDIDGDSKGSIQFDDEYIHGSPSRNGLHKPSLDIDLNTVLPRVVQQLILGKGRGTAFVTNKVSEIWRATPRDAKETIQQVLRENFYEHIHGEEEFCKSEKHMRKVAEWFYALLKQASPWDNWTRDIYDAMRCFDHLPIS